MRNIAYRLVGGSHRVDGAIAVFVEGGPAMAVSEVGYLV